MAGFMAGLDAESYDRQYSDQQLYGRILERFRPQRTQLFWLVTLVFLQGLAGTGVPLLISHILDYLQERVELVAVLGLVGAAIALGGIDWLLNYRKQAIAARAIGDMVLSLRGDTLRATLFRDMRFFDTHQTGRLISRITSDTQEMGSLVTLFSEVLSSLMIVVMVTTIMLVKSWKLALLTLVTVPFIWVATLVFRSVARRMSTGSRRVLGVLNGIINESVSGISVAKGFRQEQAIYEGFQLTNHQGYQVNLRQGWTFNTIFPALNGISGLGIALVTYYGGLSAMDPQSSGITVGDWYFFLQSANLVFFPLTSLASFYSQLQNGLASSERVFALLEGASELKQELPLQDPGRILGNLDLQDIHFRYVHNEQVFEGLNLTIPAGQSVALVGHTGAGKSSIVNLLARYYEFQDGRILVDGKDIRSLNLDSYRKKLGIILQEQLLFDATVADNIRYGRPDASDAEVLGALSALGAAWLVDELPEGLNTRVRERGSRLSLGQRQLISMARTMLQDPAILVMDEATASVDPLTEVQLQRALERVMKGRTTLIIAHRLTTIRHVDRIVVLDHGRIVEEGTHDGLLKKEGTYALLYNTYYRHQSLEYIETLAAG